MFLRNPARQSPGSISTKVTSIPKRFYGCLRRNPSSKFWQETIEKGKRNTSRNERFIICAQTGLHFRNKQNVPRDINTRLHDSETFTTRPHTPLFIPKSREWMPAHFSCYLLLMRSGMQTNLENWKMCTNCVWLSRYWWW